MPLDWSRVSEQRALDNAAQALSWIIDVSPNGDVQFACDIALSKVREAAEIAQEQKAS